MTLKAILGAEAGAADMALCEEGSVVISANPRCTVLLQHNQLRSTAYMWKTGQQAQSAFTTWYRFIYPPTHLPFPRLCINIHLSTFVFIYFFCDLKSPPYNLSTHS